MHERGDDTMTTWPDKDELRAKLPGLVPATRRCLAFFTRLPAGEARHDKLRPGDLTAWPLAGVLVTLGPALLLAILLATNGEAFIASVVALAALAALQGGLHEDGLADVADGFGGGDTDVEKLSIMRDSRIGTYGVLALLFLVVLKIGSLTVIADEAPAAAFGALFMAAALSRLGALYHWAALPTAREDGLAASIGRPDWAGLVLSGLIALGVAIAAAFLTGFGALLLGLAGTAAAAFLFTDLVQRQIGGHTGDTIGAAQQLCEVAVLAAIALSF